MRVLIVDDHPLVRKGLSLTFSFEENIETIQEASIVEEAMEILSKNETDIAIVDLRLGQEDGLEIVKRVKMKGLVTKIIILTSSIRKEDFLRAQKVGVDGYILKQAFAEDIVYALHAVARGKKFFDSDILQFEANEVEEPQLSELTLREKDVFIALGKGLSNQQIAEKLFISEHTVKKHVSSIFSKLGLNHRAEAVVFVSNTMK